MCPLSIKFLRMSFIMVWKVAGEFVSPKNMTVGSKSPLLVWKVAFHSSPSFIRTLLYPQWKSNLEKTLDPFSLSNELLYQGQGVAVLDRAFVQFPVVLDRSERTILLFDEEEG